MKVKSKLSKAARYKTIIQISIIFLYTYEEQPENEFEKNNPIYNNIKKNKTLRDNFGKSSTKEEDLINWKNIPSHELDDNIRMAIFSKLIYRFNTIIRIPDDFFVEMIE